MSQRIEIPLVGGQYIGRSTDVDAQECINLYPALDRSGGKPLSLHAIPGLPVWVDMEVGEHEVRAMFDFGENIMYAVIGDTVYKFNDEGGFAALAMVLENDSGPIQMVSNGTQILIADLTDNNGYVLEGDVVSRPADLVGVSISSLTYQNGYGIISIKDTQNYRISTLDVASLAAYAASDFTRWDALEIGTAEGLPDNIRATFSDHEELWQFGAGSIEIHGVTANQDFPYIKTEHPYQEIGLGGSPASILKLDNSLYWPDVWRNIRRAQGYTPVIISTPEITYNLEQFSKISDATGFSYMYEGQAFAVFNFPDAGETYCYEVSTDSWHKRSSARGGGRWRGNCYVKFAGKHLIGDYRQSKIYFLDHSVYTEDGERVKATRTTRYTSAQNRYIFYHRLELHIQYGVGLGVAEGEAGYDPQIMMSYSDNAGRTWSGEKWASMGKIGEKARPVHWDKLGKSKDRIFKFEITDPVKRVLIALYADITIGTH